MVLSFNSARMLPFNTPSLTLFKLTLCPNVDVGISAVSANNPGEGEEP